MRGWPDPTTLFLPPPGSWLVDQYATLEVLGNIFALKWMKQESRLQFAHEVIQVSSLVLFLKVFDPSCPRGKAIRLSKRSNQDGLSLCVNYNFMYKMALLYVGEIDVSQHVAGGGGVFIAHSCCFFNSCLLLFKQTVIPSRLSCSGNTAKLWRTLFLQMQCEISE